MLWRRIKYSISGKFMRLVMGLISSALVIGLVCLCMSGAFSQTWLVKTCANFFIDSGKVASEKIADAMTGDTAYISVTDQGIYFKGCEPKGAKIIKGDKIELNEDKSNIHFDPDTGLIEDIDGIESDNNFSGKDDKRDK